MISVIKSLRSTVTSASWNKAVFLVNYISEHLHISVFLTYKLMIFTDPLLVLVMSDAISLYASDFSFKYLLYRLMKVDIV